MSDPTPFELLENVASDIVFADISDKPGIVQLMDTLERIGRAIKQRGGKNSKKITKVIKDSSELLNNVILDMGGDPQTQLDQVSENISKLQYLFNEISSCGVADDGESPVENGIEEPEDDEEERQNSQCPPETDCDFVLPDNVDESTFEEFLAQQKLGLEELEGLILDVEGDDADARSEFKRRIHTLKGESGVLGLQDISEVCHAIEDFLELDVEMSILIDRLLQTKDWLTQSVDSYSKKSYPSPRASELIAALLSENSVDAEPPSPETSEAPAVEEPETIAEPEPPEEEPEASDEPQVPETETGEEAGVDGDVDAIAAETGDSRNHGEKAERDEETVSMLGEFLNEGEEGLATADEILMNIEHDGLDPEKINALFRVFHTIKGVAGFLELSDITSLAHVSETLLNLVRQGTRELQGATLDLIFDSTAKMRELLNVVHQAVESDEIIISDPQLPDLLTSLQDAIDGKAAKESPLPKVQAGEKLGEILEKSASVRKEALDTALQSQKESGRRLGEELVRSGEVPAKAVSQALRAQRATTTGKAQAAKLKETIKVDLERVDSLVEMVGELVIVESMVVNAPEITSLQSPKIRNYLGQLTKISRDLQSVGMQIRMVPVRSVFQKMARMVRDLSRKNKKEIGFIQSGEGTEMDRSMVESIGDPLVHMIRNAVDHGIESTEEREATGKPAKGTVHLSAYHEGGSIIIEVSDDGKGLNKSAILNKALKQGLIRDGDSLSDPEIYNLIFAPGFSTAQKVTEISGRGVGMDVVKRNIESMRGRVMIDSRPGKGTVFKMILPLTLAIIDGMLVKCGPERYIIPTLSIIESIKPNMDQISKFADKGELINLRGQILPIVRLSDLFSIDGATQNIADGLVVIIEGIGKRIGLVVDDVLTQQQVVIKNLGQGLEDMKYASGAAIMSDGTVGLILNVEEITNLLNTMAGHAVA